MKISVEIMELLRKYVNGNLTEEERARVEQMLVEQPELHEELSFTKTLIEETEQVERERLMAVIKKTSPSASEFDVKGPKGGIKWLQIPASAYRQAGLAAGILILLAVGLWYFAFRDNVFDTFRQQAYISPEVSTALNRGGSDKDALQKAHQEYEQARYQQSLSSLSNASPEDSLYLFSLFLKAYNHYQLEQYDQAVQAFDQLLSPQNSKPRYVQPNPDNAAWGRILSALALWRETGQESRREELETLLDDFLERASPSDAYYQKGAQLQELLQLKPLPLSFPFFLLRQMTSPSTIMDATAQATACQGFPQLWLQRAHIANRRKGTPVAGGGHGCYPERPDRSQCRTVWLPGGPGFWVALFSGFHKSEP